MPAFKVVGVPVFLHVDLEQDGFSKNPFFHGIIAEVPEQHKTKEGERGTVTSRPVSP